ncbi:hypothetical protein GCM10009624_12370 [Gordonia sinesedis]
MSDTATADNTDTNRADRPEDPDAIDSAEDHDETTESTQDDTSATTADSAFDSDENSDPRSRWRRIRASRRFWMGVLAVLVVALSVSTAFFAWQAKDQRAQLDDLRTRTADTARAEQVASDYAVAAARIDYRNFDPWFASLRRNVAPKLADQFTASEPALRDLLGQLQWVSTGTLVGSDVASQNGSTYVVQVFVDVTTSNVQSPDGVKTTALYPITVDGNGWRITDISGGVAPLPK